MVKRKPSALFLTPFQPDSHLSQDIFSFNVEQSRGDTHNMIVILMEHHGMTLQQAVDYVGDLCKQTIDAFCQNKGNLPSWGPEIDDMVARYVQGLQDWIVGLVAALPYNFSRRC
jgi:alpha-muurolene/germacrene-A/gamma-muurolene synthase